MSRLFLYIFFLSQTLHIQIICSNFVEKRFMILLNLCMERECCVWTIKDNYRLGDDLNAKVLAFAFGLSAEIERNLIAQRTREALARKRAEGVHIGRPFGRQTGVDKLRLYRYDRRIRALRRDGMSVYAMVRVLGVNRNSLRRYIDRVGI